MDVVVGKSGSGDAEVGGREDSDSVTSRSGRARRGSRACQQVSVMQPQLRFQHAQQSSRLSHERREVHSERADEGSLNHGWRFSSCDCGDNVNSQLVKVTMMAAVRKAW